LKFWLGVTDNRWFNFLAGRRLEEVNFWQPSATPPFLNAPIGMPFLFKLKRPHNHIGGGGYFVTYSRLPISLAWEVFGEKNGAGSLDELTELVAPLRAERTRLNEIGCTVLANPVFFPKENWIQDPIGWAGSIVRGKMYDTAANDGSHVWNAWTQRLGREVIREDLERDPTEPLRAGEPERKYGEPILVQPRIGQASFRVLVTEAYKRRCAITGENTLIALEAAHIVPYATSGTHEIQNGLLLRADFHRLFDVGLIAVTPDLKIRVSPKIRETWFNGKVYYSLDKRPLSVLPDNPKSRPDPDRLKWHLDNRFQA